MSLSCAFFVFYRNFADVDACKIVRPKAIHCKGGCSAMPIHIFNIRKQHKEK